MRLWRIVPQIVRVKGEEVEVDVKLVRFFPELCPTTNQVVGFGWLAPSVMPYQVIIQRANWGPEDVWRVQYNPTTNKFRIVYREWDDPVDPRSRHWTGPGHVIRRVEEDRGMSLALFMQTLAERVKDPQFEGQILGLLMSADKQAVA